VKDSGPGIPEAELAHIFELYYRTEGAARKSVPGSGLGLFIVKSLVDAHGGKVEVTSEPGKGTAFNIRLPLAQPG
jgi:signal transduction histidine kinase